MAIVAVGDIFEVRSVMRYLEQNFLNIYHYRSATGFTDPDPLTKVGTTWLAKFLAPLQAVVSESVKIQGVGVKILFPNETAETLVPTADAMGADIGFPEATQVSAVISLRAAAAPPRVRGRKYIGGLAEDGIDNENQAWYPATWALLQELGNKMVENLNFSAESGTSSVAPIIYTRETHAWYVITSALARHRIGTQRRRSHITRPDQDVFN